MPSTPMHPMPPYASHASLSIPCLPCAHTGIQGLSELHHYKTRLVLHRRQRGMQDLLTGWLSFAVQSRTLTLAPRPIPASKADTSFMYCERNRNQICRGAQAEGTGGGRTFTKARSRSIRSSAMTLLNSRRRYRRFRCRVKSNQKCALSSLSVELLPRNQNPLNATPSLFPRRQGL